MTIFLVLWLCSFRIREVEYSIKSSIGLKNETKKFGERAQLYCTLMWDFFWDHTISLSLLGALECVVRVLMHFCFWNIEGTLVSIDHCGFKVMFLFHVFIRSKHLTVLCQVSGHAFSWNSQQLLMWRSSSAMSLFKMCAPELQSSQCPGWPLALRVHPPIQEPLHPVP